MIQPRGSGHEKKSIEAGDLVQPIATPGAVVVDFVSPSLKVPLHMRRIQAGEAVRIVVTGDHVDDVLCDIDVLSHAGEHCPLILIHPVPAQSSGIVGIDHVSELIIAETEVRVEEPGRLQLFEKSPHPFGGRAVRGPRCEPCH